MAELKTKHVFTLELSLLVSQANVCSSTIITHEPANGSLPMNQQIKRKVVR